MTRRTKGRIVKTVGITLDVVAPLVATLTQFPVWVHKDAYSTVSGLFLVFAFLSCLPFIRQIKEYMKSPSAPVLWSVMFVLLVLLRNIINEMVMVCFVGMISNMVGSCIYKIGKNIEGSEA